LYDGISGGYTMKYSYPEDYQKLKKDVDNNLGRINNILILITELIDSGKSKDENIDRLIGFLRSTPIKTRLDQSLLTVTILCSSFTDISKIFDSHDILDNQNQSLFLEQINYDVSSEDEIIASLVARPLKHYAGTSSIERKYFIRPAGRFGKFVTSVEFKDDTIRIEGRCPSNFNFFHQISSTLSIAKLHLILSQPSEICDITEIAVIKETVEEVRFLNLRILSSLPLLRSLSLTSDKVGFILCPVIIPLILSDHLEYLELRAGQLFQEQLIQDRKIYVHNGELKHIQIYADRGRMNWVELSDYSETALNRVSKVYSEDEELLFVLPEENQKLIDRISSGEGMEGIKRMNIILRPETLEETRKFSEASYLEQIYNLLFPIHHPHFSIKRYQKFKNLAVTISAFTMESCSGKFPLLKFENLLMLKTEQETLTQILPYIEYSKFPVHFILPEGNVFYKFNEFVFYHGPCKMAPNLSLLSVETLHVNWKKDEECDLSDLAIYEKTSLLSKLVIFKTSTKKKAEVHSIPHLNLVGLEYLKVIKILINSPILISPPSGPFTAIEKLVLPQFYMLQTPFVISSRLDNLTIEGASITEYYRILT
jgi:hypothetical protein